MRSKKGNIIFGSILMLFVLAACGKTEPSSNPWHAQESETAPIFEAVSPTESQAKTIVPRQDVLLNEKDGNNIPDGVYHVSGAGNTTYDGQYLSLEFWGYDVYECSDIESLKEGDSLLFKGQVYAVAKLETESYQGELKRCLINGEIEEGGICLCFDYEEYGFRGLEENDSYCLYPTGTRRIRISDSFLYDDHASVPNIGDAEPDWARGDITGFASFMKDRELYAQNTYAAVRDGEIISLTIEWVP